MDRKTDLRSASRKGVSFLLLVFYHTGDSPSLVTLSKCRIDGICRKGVFHCPESLPDSTKEVVIPHVRNEKDESF